MVCNNEYLKNTQSDFQIYFSREWFAPSLRTPGPLEDILLCRILGIYFRKADSLAA